MGTIGIMCVLKIWLPQISSSPQDLNPLMMQNLDILCGFHVWLPQTTIQAPHPHPYTRATFHRELCGDFYCLPEGKRTKSWKQQLTCSATEMLGMQYCWDSMFLISLLLSECLTTDRTLLLLHFGTRL